MVGMWGYSQARVWLGFVVCMCEYVLCVWVCLGCVLACVRVHVPVHVPVHMRARMCGRMCVCVCVCSACACACVCFSGHGTLLQSRVHTCCCKVGLTSQPSRKPRSVFADANPSPHPPTVPHVARVPPRYSSSYYKVQRCLRWGLDRYDCCARDILFALTLGPASAE